MKLKYFKGLLILVFLLVYIPLQSGIAEIAKTKTVKIKCTEMSCAGCKKKITQSIKNLEGIKKINVDLETKIITVTFDELKTDTEKILGAIAEAGYESELIE